MFELNPLNLPNAMWQHLVMLVVAAIIGYIIGYRSSRSVATSLEAELADLDVELSHCHDSKATKVATLTEVTLMEPVDVAKSVDFIAPEPIDPVVITPPIVSIPVNDPMKMTPIEPDNLKLVEGIGPKIEELLNKEGILTFRHLSEASNERLEDILRAAGSPYRMHDPESWPLQAQMAASGQWKEFMNWQKNASKGRLA